MTTKRARRTQGQAVASWILGSIFGSFLIGVYVFEGRTVTPEQHKLLGLFGAFTAAAFSFFFTGNIGLKLTSIKRGWFQVSLKATSGVAVFVLVLYWWSGAHSPILKPVTNLRVEVQSFISQLEAELNTFEIKLKNSEGERRNELAVVLDEKRAVLSATVDAKEKMDEFLHRETLNRNERDAVLAAINRLSEKAQAIEQEINNLRLQRSPHFPRQSVGPTNGSPNAQNRSSEESDDPTEAALNKFGLSSKGGNPIVVMMDGMFPHTVTIHFMPASIATAERIQQKMRELHAQKITLLTNVEPSTLAGKIIYQPDRDRDLNLRGADNIRQIIMSIDRTLGDEMKVVRWSSVQSADENNENSAPINVYLP